jgi:RNA polymerase sigma factor (sigma-70 family)
MHSTHHTPDPARSAEELFRAHNDQLVQMLQRRLGVSQEVAEDAVGLAWLQFLRTQPDGERLVGWLYTVAKHEAFALLGRARREVPVESTALIATVRELDDSIDARDAVRVIADLKPQQRLVLWLRAEGHSYNSICSLTGRTYTWVNRHISEGRRALRRLIAES